MRALLLMAKAPRPGLAKSRLVDGGALDPPTVARLADAFLRDTLAVCRRVAHDTLRITFTPPDSAPYFRALAPTAALDAQVEGDLGARLSAAFRVAFDGGATHAVVLGMDTPHLSPDAVAAAFEALERFGCVLGPASDGGYYLIGLAAPCPELFQGITWSTRTVLAETRRKAADAGLRVALLDELYDVDEPRDLARLAEDLRGGRVECPFTAAVLAETGALGPTQREPPSPPSPAPR